MDELKADASKLEMSIVAAKAEYERIKNVNKEVSAIGMFIREECFFFSQWHSLPSSDCV
jgi:hypothetical protein